MSTSAVPGPLRHFAARLDELRSGDVPDMEQVGRVLAELAADEEFLGPLIAQIPTAAPGDRWLIRPQRGPRLVLVHRPDGVMSHTHSHRCWVGIVPVRGVETISGGDAVRHQDGHADLRLADERAGNVFVLSVGPAAYGADRLASGHQDRSSMGMLAGGIAVGALFVMLAVRHHRQQAAPMARHRVVAARRRHLLAGDVDEARAVFAEASTAAAGMSNRDNIPVCEAQLAWLAMDRGEWQEPAG